jgi:GDPmannose 4,6-dehydratase
MLQQDRPDDYVVATGETHSVREFLEVVFDRLKLDAKRLVDFDPRFTRPAEVDILIGDYGKAKRVLGWEPRVKFKELAEMMVASDLELAEREKRSLG